MSPNMTCEALQAFSPRQTVAKRKEALELRKVSGLHFSLLSSHFFLMFYTYCNEQILNIMCSFQTMKPLMEKRRRARINNSLNHLKNLILPLTGRDVSWYIHLNICNTDFRFAWVNATFWFICLTFDFYHFLQKSRYSKLEKADILEMTVRFLSDIPPVNTKSELWFCLDKTCIAW